jgi:hypothetical protein
MSWKPLTFALSAVLAAGTIHAASRAETKRTVYVSVLDAKGVPVTDLTAADLSIKEGGQDRAIASVKESEDPIDIAILDDDDGSGAFAPAVLQLIQTLGDRAQYAFNTFTPARVKVMDYTNDVPPIQAGLDKIGKRGKVGNPGEQLEVGVSDVAKELKARKAPRRVILVLSVAGEGTTQNATVVMDELAGSGAMLYLMYHQNAKIGLVLGDGPKTTGGKIEMIGSMQAIPPAMTRIANALLHQYAVTYTLPDGVKPSDRINVATTRKGVTLLAPSRLPTS